MSFKFFRKHTKDGLEKPDPTPIEVPLSQKPVSLVDQMARLVRDENFNAHLRNQGVDTFDEANDFDVSDQDPDLPPSPYELRDGELPVQTRQDEIRGGKVSEMPIDRSRKAQERMYPPKKAPMPKKLSEATVDDLAEAIAQKAVPKKAE